MSTNHIMVDLETLSTQPNAMILSIGAVAFDINNPEFTLTEDNSFYRVIDFELLGQSTNPTKYHIDLSTIKWWFGQSQEARQHLLSNDVFELSCALQDLSEFMRDNESIYLWGNGANFDNEILRHAFVSENIEPPWKYYNDRCYRTIKGLNPNIPRVKPYIPHHALHDAAAQTEHLLKIMHQ